MMHINDYRQAMMDRVEIRPNGCWRWKLGVDKDGYAVWDTPRQSKYKEQFGGTNRAGRIMYILTKGEIQKGLELDHICNIRRCINPDHLQPLTRQENQSFAISYGSTKTECKNGHEFTEDNTYIPKDGERCCRTCNRERQRERTRRLRRMFE